MLSPDGTITRLIARVKARLASDWWGKAGGRFREAVQRVSNFAEQHHIQPNELLGEGVELGRRKLDGLANQEFAAAVKNFADAERSKIETELQRRSLESKVRKEEAEARVSELKALDAEVELLVKLTALGVVLHRDGRGNLTVMPTQGKCDLGRLIEDLRLESSREANSNEDHPLSHDRPRIEPITTVL